jgi:hypothetical protein
MMVPWKMISRQWSMHRRCQHLTIHSNHTGEDRFHDLFMCLVCMLDSAARSKNMMTDSALNHRSTKKLTVPQEFKFHPINGTRTCPLHSQWSKLSSSSGRVAMATSWLVELRECTWLPSQTSSISMLLLRMLGLALNFVDNCSTHFAIHWLYKLWWFIQQGLISLAMKLLAVRSITSVRHKNFIEAGVAEGSMHEWHQRLLPWGSVWNFKGPPAIFSKVGFSCVFPVVLNWLIFLSPPTRKGHM